MKLSIAFIRNFFPLVSALIVTAYAVSAFSGGLTIGNLTVGLIAGLCLGFLMLTAGRLLERFSLRVFNIAAIGLLLGYLMGTAINILLDAAFTLGGQTLEPEILGMAKVLVFLGSIYFSMVLTAKGAEEITLSIPFVKFSPTAEKKRDILLDASVLADTRLIDLVGTGLVDNYLVLPRYILAELQDQTETALDPGKARARRALEVVKKLEAMPYLALRFSDTDLTEIKDPMLKLVRVARLLDANILTADINRIQQSEIEGVRVVNIHALANALKRIAQTGECLDIKVQHHGRESRQGVGYLDDGTMVVINGGAQFLDKTIKARVLSVKHTSSGRRMVFCNTIEEEGEQYSAEASSAMQSSRYFAMDERN